MNIKFEQTIQTFIGLCSCNLHRVWHPDNRYTLIEKVTNTIISLQICLHFIQAGGTRELGIRTH
jgi:hypothetical protein